MENNSTEKTAIVLAPFMVPVPQLLKIFFFGTRNPTQDLVLARQELENLSSRLLGFMLIGDIFLNSLKLKLPPTRTCMSSQLCFITSSRNVIGTEWSLKCPPK